MKGNEVLIISVGWDEVAFEPTSPSCHGRDIGVPGPYQHEDESKVCETESRPFTGCIEGREVRGIEFNILFS